MTQRKYDVGDLLVCNSIDRAWPKGSKLIIDQIDKDGKIWMKNEEGNMKLWASQKTLDNDYLLHELTLSPLWQALK